MKSVLKEIIIILLLCCAICLILGVVFYDYIPTNKVIPSTVEPYTTSNTIKEEINQEITEFQKQTIVMEITDSDLKIHKQERSYDSGKINPFAKSSSGTTNTEKGDKNTTGDTNQNPDSKDYFFNNQSGLK
ncbi:unknown [Clostridium sp. CAG:780]|jgi:hypothetical protein|nr:unknown [Clostridium sp. CAG:780]